MLTGITVPKLGAVSAPLSVTTASSDATAFPTPTSGSVVVRIQSTTDGFIRFGASNMDAASTTTGHFIAGGNVYDVEKSGSHFRFIAASAAGTLYVSELY